MRKAIALSVLIVVFIPLAFATLSLVSVRGWILDRSFYERIVGDERIYSPLLNQELPNRLENALFTDTEQIPLSALSVALREVLTPAYLRDQSLRIVDQVFDLLEQPQVPVAISVDITPVKASLASDDGGARFANALASALPDCAAGQDPISRGGRLPRCIAPDRSTEAVAAQIAAALPGVLENTPDTLMLSEPVDLGVNWPTVRWFTNMAVGVGLDVAIIVAFLSTLAIGVFGAAIGGDDLRGMLRWFSSALFFPASLFVLIGVSLSAPFLSNPVRASIIAARWGSTQYSEAFRSAVADVIMPVVQQIGAGMLVAGVVAALIALVALGASWFAPNSPSSRTVTVQVPARNA